MHTAPVLSDTVPHACLVLHNARHLALLDSVITSVTRSRRMQRDDVDDFRQAVHLRLIERNYEPIRRFAGRSSMKTYLTVVVRRLLLDWQNQAMGKWRPSAAARRLGDTAEQLERLLHRDGCAMDEAVGYLCARHGHLEPEAVRRLALALPPRVPRAVRLTQAQSTTVEFHDPVEARAQAAHTAARRAGLARALKHLERTDRSLVFLRYRKQLTVQHIAQREAVDAKALYRRFDRILLRLRRQLAVDGIARL
jgi:RNA polymerase sigma factor (sigma-70 family)